MTVLSRFRGLILGVAVVSGLTLWTLASEEVQAQGGPLVTPSVDCFMPDSENPGYSLASFGYQNKSNSTYSIPIQPFANYFRVDGAPIFNAGQPIEFPPGIHRGSFWIRYIDGLNDIRWILQNITVSPDATTPVCNAGMVGPTGPQGDQGPPGRDGLDGLDGAIGPTGPAGPAGAGVSFRGSWNATVVYAPNDLVSFLGSTWIAGNYTKVPDLPPNNSTVWKVFTPAGEVGPAGPGFKFRGGWNATVPYSPNDVVSHLGSSWLRLNATVIGDISNEPSMNSTVWDLVASVGERGEPGIAGKDGAKGATGATGAQGLPGLQGAIGPAGVGFNFRGLFSINATYLPNDVVSFGSSVWVRANITMTPALRSAASSGSPGSDPAWQLMVPNPFPTGALLELPEGVPPPDGFKLIGIRKAELRRPPKQKGKGDEGPEELHFTIFVYQKQ